MEQDRHNDKGTGAEMVLMVGGPGAGKSTIREKMFGTSLPVVDCDLIKAAHPSYDAKNPSALHPWAEQKCAQAVMAAIASGESFIYDSTGTNVERLSLYVAAAHSVGMKVKAVAVLCNLATSLRRNATRDRIVPEEVVKAKHAMLAEALPVIKSLVDECEIVENF